MRMRSAVLDNKTIMITGAAGFIGASFVVRLLQDCDSCTIVGVDNLNEYSSEAHKYARLDWIGKAAALSTSSWTFIRVNIADKDAINGVFDDFNPEIVVHLAAQAGVRYSIDHPDAYIESNIIGFYNILEACRWHPVAHLVFASSSSVYGGNAHVPFSTDDKTDAPVSLYAATKKSDELLAYAYCKLYGTPMTALRFFTVYGPYGRSDMFIYLATEKLLAGDTIQLYNYGKCQRDFTYIDDVVEGLMRVVSNPNVMRQHDDSSEVSFALFNIGGGHPEIVIDVVDILQQELVAAGALPADYDVQGHLELVEMQPGDVLITYADTSPFENAYGFKPKTSIREGIRKFVSWYLGYAPL